jgi:hypothetical protein
VGPSPVSVHHFAGAGALLAAASRSDPLVGQIAGQAINQRAANKSIQRARIGLRAADASRQASNRTLPVPWEGNRNVELFDKPLSKFTGAPVKKGTGHLSEANLLILPRRGSISSMAFEEGWVRSRIFNCRFRLPPPNETGG